MWQALLHMNMNVHYIALWNISLFFFRLTALDVLVQSMQYALWLTMLMANGVFVELTANNGILIDLLLGISYVDWHKASSSYTFFELYEPFSICNFIYGADDQIFLR